MGTWIYFNEKSKLWQVKMWNESKREADILREFATRGEAWAFSAYGNLVARA